MNAQKIAKFIWEELVAFLAWTAPAIWNMFASYKPKEDEVEVTGQYETEDGYVFTHNSDGTTDVGPPGI